MAVAQDRGEEAVAAYKGFGLALELDLVVLVQIGLVLLDAVIEDGIEFVAVGTTEIQRHQVLYLRPAVDLLVIQIGFQVMQLVGIGFTGLDRSAVVVLERLLHSFGVVGEVQHEGVMLLRVRSVQAR